MTEEMLNHPWSKPLGEALAETIDNEILKKLLSTSSTVDENESIDACQLLSDILLEELNEDRIHREISEKLTEYLTKLLADYNVKQDGLKNGDYEDRWYIYRSSKPSSYDNKVYYKRIYRDAYN